MDYHAPLHKDEPAGKPEPRQLTEVNRLRTFLYAGNATITLVSTKTGTRFTYRIKSPTLKEGERPGSVGWFVALMNGPDNETNFQYLGHIYQDSKDYMHGRKSKIGYDAPSAKAWEWFYHTVVRAGVMSNSLEIWHEGRCGRCNRKLTVPESIDRGIGPECAKWTYDYSTKDLLERQ